MPLKVNTMLNCIRVEEVARYLGIFLNTAAMDRLNGDKPWMSPFVEYIPHEAVEGDIVRDDMNEVFEVRSGGLLLSQIDGPEENFEDLFTDTAVVVQGLVEHGIL